MNLDQMIDARDEYLEKITIAKRVQELSKDEKQRVLAKRDIRLFESFVEQLEIEIQAEMKRLEEEE